MDDANPQSENNGQDAANNGTFHEKVLQPSEASIHELQNLQPDPQQVNTQPPAQVSAPTANIEQQSPTVSIKPTYPEGANVDSKLTSAVDLLKQCKTQGLSYYEATHSLEKQGFSQEEIEQASYQFPYSDASLPGASSSQLDASLNKAAAEVIGHQEEIDLTKKQMHQDTALGLLGRRSLIGQYYGNKAVADYANLKDLEQYDPNDPLSLKKPQQTGNRVFQRHRAVKYFAIISLFPIIGLLAYLALIIPGLLHNPVNFSALIVPVFIYLILLSIPLVLFLAKKESTIVNFIYLLMGIEFLFSAAMAFIFRNPILLLFSAVTIVPSYWISKKVGLLSQLQ